jgi:hypothetical protein
MASTEKVPLADHDPFAGTILSASPILLPRAIPDSSYAWWRTTGPAAEGGDEDLVVVISTLSFSTEPYGVPLGRLVPFFISARGAEICPSTNREIVKGSRL